MPGVKNHNEMTDGHDHGPDDGLTPELREILCVLALMSERHIDISTALNDSSRELSVHVERCPQLKDTHRQLQAQLGQLRDLQHQLGVEVMRFSHYYEDAMVE